MLPPLNAVVSKLLCECVLVYVYTEQCFQVLIFKMNTILVSVNYSETKIKQFWFITRALLW
jgi:hypothetical protein